MNATLLKENPLLLLITIQAYAVNDLVVEPDIKQLILDNIDLLKQIKPEDAYKEFKKIMTTVHPDRYIREFKEVFFELIPGLKGTYNFNQNNKWHIYDVFEHTMHVIDNTDCDSAALRIAALFHDLGKPSAYTKEEKQKEDGTTYTVGHFYGHNIKSNIFFNEFAKTMHIPEEERKLISKLIIYHDYHLSLKPEKIQEYIDDLTLGLSILINRFNPDIVVIGGGFARYDYMLLEPLKEKLYNSNLLNNKKIRIQTAKSGNDAGIIGACLI